MENKNVTALLREVQEKGYLLKQDDALSQNALREAAQNLANALESPIERVGKLSWYEPTMAFAIRVLIDMKLFQKIAADGSPKLANDLAISVGAEPKLVERLLKHISTAHYVDEVGPDTYTPNEMTRTLARADAQGAFTNCFDGLAPINAKAVEYFRQPSGFMNPIDKDKSLFKFAFNTDMHYFDWVYQPGNEEQAQAFQQHMRMKTMGPKWFQTVPVEDILGPAKADEVLLVDVGGAAGHDLQAFHKAFPDLPGRLILQDRPESIPSLDASALAPIEPMGHNFFTPQPLKGARGYYMKMVLHDWPDAQCTQILENLKPALVPGQSKILINEITIPETGAGSFETSVDMLMMTCHAAYERREREWKAVVESAGLTITKIWQCGSAVEKLMVVELP
ncbi:O-methyltransferase [Thozetella sp. PMI_491]|nr:O-methyltransferase [Thozetella sp. PMI_491]